MLFKNNLTIVLLILATSLYSSISAMNHSMKKIKPPLKNITVRVSEIKNDLPYSVYINGKIPIASGTSSSPLELIGSKSLESETNNECNSWINFTTREGDVTHLTVHPAIFATLDFYRTLQSKANIIFRSPYTRLHLFGGIIDLWKDSYSNKKSITKKKHITRESYIISIHLKQNNIEPTVPHHAIPYVLIGDLTPSTIKVTATVE